MPVGVVFGLRNEEDVKRGVQKGVSGGQAIGLTLVAGSQDVERKVGQVLVRRAQVGVGLEDAKTVARVVRGIVSLRCV